MRFYRAAGLALLISLSLGACVPGSVRPSAQEQAAASQAQVLASQGNYDQAAQAYIALAQGGSALADHYRLLAAESYRQQGKLARGGDLLGSINRQSLSGDEPIRLDLLRAELELGRNNPHAALKLTTQPNLNVPADLQVRLLELRARAMDASGDPWGAARTRVQMDASLNGLDQSQNRRQIIALLDKLGVPALRQRAAAMKPGDRMLAWINEALTHQGVAVANPQPELGQPVGTMMPGSHASVREGYSMPRQVALLLAGNGNYAFAAKALREGFFAAYAESARIHAPRADVHIYDTAGTADGAVKAYQQATRDGAQLVVGPLTRGAVTAIFGQSALPVPVLALNHADGGNLPAGNAMEFGLLPETEGAQAADHMVERGLRTAYVITSVDDFAVRAASAFKAELAARGGQVVSAAQLSVGEVNYASAISALNASTASNAGIFISMRPEQARLLLPQLRVARIDLPVFGTSHIYGGVDDPAANRDLDGVEFCDAPWLFNAQPGLPARNDLASQLPAVRGNSARLFAFGMDAWNLVPYLDWLRSHVGSYMPGATGQLAADQFGRIRRVLVWARFNDGIAQPLSGSLQMDDVPSNAPPDQPSSNNNPPAPVGGSARLPAENVNVPTR